MLLNKTGIALAVIGAAALFGAPAIAQTATSSNAPEAMLASNYADFAGSQKNADALVSGLRNDSSIILTSSNPFVSSATFTPATDKLGYGNVNIALALAKADLARAGITQPTPTQLAAALNGGTFMTLGGPITMAGVLAMRSDGMGWGRIAQEMGGKLGTIVSSSRSDNSRAGRSGSTTTSASGRGGGRGNSSGKEHDAAGTGRGSGQGRGGDVASAHGGGHGGGAGGGGGGGGEGGGHGGGEGGGGGGGK